MPVPPMHVPMVAQPFPHQQMNQPPQRFFHNPQNQFNQRQKPMNNNNSHPYQQRQMPPQQSHQQQNQQAPNPFIPLQASRKATKSKNAQAESKNAHAVKEKVKPLKEIPVPKPAAEKAPSQETVSTAGTSKPTVDNRRCRVAIDFSK